MRSLVLVVFLPCSWCAIATTTLSALRFLEGPELSGCSGSRCRLGGHRSTYFGCPHHGVRRSARAPGPPAQTCIM